MVGLVAFGAEDEEQGERDPIAVIGHPQRPVEADTDRERDAEADRVAGDRRFEVPIGAHSGLGAGPVPAALVVGIAVVDEPDAARPGGLDEPAERPVEQGGERVATAGSEESLADHQRHRGAEADEREPQGVGEEVAGGGGDQSPSRAPRPVPTGWRGRRAPPPPRPAAPRPPARARAGPAGASSAVKPQTKAAVAIAPCEGQSNENSKIRASAIGTATRTPRRSAGPGAAGPIAKSGEARSRSTSPEASYSRDGTLGRAPPRSILGGRDPGRDQWQSRDGSRAPRGARGGARLIPLPLRAAVGPGLPLRGHRSLRRRARRRRLAQRRPPRPDLRRQLLGDLHPARADRDRARLVPLRKQAPVDSDLGLADHRDGRPLRRLALHHQAEQGVARPGAALTGGQRRPDRRRRRVRDRLEPLHRPDPRRDPFRRRGRRLRRSTAPSCSPSTRPAWRSPS